MELIADGLLVATALTATVYCLVLSRRLRKLGDSGAGIGQQIEKLNAALEETRTALSETQSGIGELKGQAKAATEKLAREVWLANQTIGEVETAAEQAREVLQKLYEADDLQGRPAPTQPEEELIEPSKINEFDPLSVGEDPKEFVAAFNDDMDLGLPEGKPAPLSNDDERTGPGPEGGVGAVGRNGLFGGSSTEAAASVTRAEETVGSVVGVGDAAPTPANGANGAVAAPSDLLRVERMVL
ncbi:MAG: hypothetical protein AAF713_10960 [Pseudomonadota bacterium]